MTNRFWSIIKQGVVRLWLLVKKSWLLLLATVSLVWCMFSYKNNSELINKLLTDRDEINKRHREELSELQRIRDQEARRQQEIEHTFQQTLEQIALRRSTDLGNLVTTKQSELRTIVEQTHDDPKLMAERVNRLFGVPVLSEEKPN